MGKHFWQWRKLHLYVKFRSVWDKFGFRLVTQGKINSNGLPVTRDFELNEIFIARPLSLKPITDIPIGLHRQI